MGVHCLAHRTNLDDQSLLDFKVMKHVEDLSVAIYFYFNFPKCILEFQKLIACLESKGNKIIENVKTH